MYLYSFTSITIIIIINKRTFRRINKTLKYSIKQIVKDKINKSKDLNEMKGAFFESRKNTNKNSILLIIF